MAYEKLRSGEAKDSLEYDNVTYNGRKLTPDKNNWYQYYHMTVTDVKSNKDKFKRIRNRELFLSDKAIRNVHTVYDPGLWADYANWDYDQEIRKALKMIEYKLPLEKQFQSSPEFLKRNFVAGIN